jgi:phage terminase Nu1 subunit (DNA packaging protein)
VDKDVYVSTAELSAFLGISPAYISKLVNAGLPRLDKHTYPFLECVKFYIQYLRQARGNESVYSEKIRLTRARAENIELQNVKLRKNALDIDDAKRQVMEIMGTLKDELLILPSEISRDLVGKSQVEIIALLENKIRTALNFVSTKLVCIVEIENEIENENEASLKRSGGQNIGNDDLQECGGLGAPE